MIQVSLCFWISENIVCISGMLWVRCIISSLPYLHFLPAHLTALLPPAFLCMTAALAPAGCPWCSFLIVQRWLSYAWAHPSLCVQENMPNLVGHYVHCPQGWFWSRFTPYFLWGNNELSFSFKGYFVCCTPFGTKSLIFWFLFLSVMSLSSYN